jgi:hypothetical protein
MCKEILGEIGKIEKILSPKNITMIAAGEKGGGTLTVYETRGVEIHLVSPKSDKQTEENRQKSN